MAELLSGRSEWGDTSVKGGKRSFAAVAKASRIHGYSPIADGQSLWVSSGPGGPAVAAVEAPAERAKMDRKAQIRDVVLEQLELYLTERKKRPGRKL
jgi:hypothetical protein